MIYNKVYRIEWAYLVCLFFMGMVLYSRYLNIQSMSGRET